MKSLNRVCIVDDEPQLLKFYVEDLENNKVKVVLYADPMDARVHLEQHAGDYDVIVVDLMMDLPSKKNDASPPELPYPDKVEWEAMGRWVMEGIPKDRPILVLTNRDPGKIDWLDQCREKFDKFEIATKRDHPSFKFYDYLKAYLVEEDAQASPVDETEGS